MHDQPVDNNEPLARYILSKEHIRSSNNTVKHNLFMPAKTNDLSVFRTLGLNRRQTNELGEGCVAAIRNKPPLGYAEFIATEAFSKGLHISGTQLPHPRHADITNWPGGLENRVIAVYLAEVSSLMLLE